MYVSMSMSMSVSASASVSSSIVCECMSPASVVRVCFPFLFSVLLSLEDMLGHHDPSTVLPAR